MENVIISNALRMVGIGEKNHFVLSITSFRVICHICNLLMRFWEKSREQETQTGHIIRTAVSPVKPSILFYSFTIGMNGDGAGGCKVETLSQQKNHFDLVFSGSSHYAESLNRSCTIYQYYDFRSSNHVFIIFFFSILGKVHICFVYL